MKISADGGNKEKMRFLARKFDPLLFGVLRCFIRQLELPLFLFSFFSLSLSLSLSFSFIYLIFHFLVEGGRGELFSKIEKCSESWDRMSFDLSRIIVGSISCRLINTGVDYSPHSEIWNIRKAILFPFICMCVCVSILSFFQSHCRRRSDNKQKKKRFPFVWYSSTLNIAGSGGISIENSYSAVICTLFLIICNWNISNCWSNGKFRVEWNVIQYSIHSINQEWWDWNPDFIAGYASIFSNCNLQNTIKSSGGSDRLVCAPNFLFRYFLCWIRPLAVAGCSITIGQWWHSNEVHHSPPHTSSAARSHSVTALISNRHPHNQERISPALRSHSLSAATSHELIIKW